MRLALPAEANAIGEIQVAAWRRAYDGLLPAQVLADLDAAQFADPRHDAVIAELAVDPEATRAGHGSRMLNAVVDTIRADGFQRVTVWINSTDDVLRGFYTESGWAADGAHRELDLYGDGTVRVKQIRLHTDPSTAD